MFCIVHAETLVRVANTPLFTTYELAEDWLNAQDDTFEPYIVYQLQS